MYQHILITGLFLIITGGEAKPPQRVLQASEATSGEFPYLASIQHNGIHECGGAIIDSRHILTAAHCFVKKYDPPYTGNMTVVTGSVNKYSGGQTHQVKKVVPHEQYQPGAKSRWRNDIAIMTLTEDMKFNRYQHKINLASMPTTHALRAVLAGWGMTAKVGDSATILQKSDVSVLVNEECNSKGARIFEDQLCGFDGKGYGFCYGDSGSPLAYNNEVVGIVSFSPSCGIGYPDVYTRVYNFVDWIENNLSD